MTAPGGAGWPASVCTNSSSSALALCTVRRAQPNVFARKAEMGGCGRSKGSCCSTLPAQPETT